MACHEKVSLGKNSPAGAILDTKTDPDGPILIDQFWSGQTSFGIQN